jgi:hypothetical protein
MQKTVNEIVKGSGLPLSIIIVGVGNANFDQMEKLDGDITPLYSMTMQKQVERDIVQFVPFNQFQNDPVRLAREVLAEIPDQLVGYFQSKGIQPNPKQIEDKTKIMVKSKM